MVLFKRAGFEEVTQSFEQAYHTGVPVLVSSIYWVEVQYMVERKAGPS